MHSFHYQNSLFYMQLSVDFKIAYFHYIHCLLFFDQILTYFPQSIGNCSKFGELDLTCYVFLPISNYFPQVSGILIFMFCRILRVLCQKLRLEENFCFSVLARLTPGFVGADLMSLAREAALIAVNRHDNTLMQQCLYNNVIILQQCSYDT